MTTIATPINASDAEVPSRASTELVDTIRDIAAHGELLYYLALRDIRVRYKQAAMGFAWALLMPLMIVSAGLMVQVILTRGSHGGFNRTALAGTLVKSIPWAFFVGALQVATNSLTSNMNLVSKIFFPREVLPLSAVVAQLFDSTVGGLAILIALPFLGVQFHLAQLWAPVILVMIVMFTTSMGLLLSCANLFFRDVKYVVQLVLTFGIFFTPVFFEPSAFGVIGSRVMMVNPLAVLLEGLRLSVVAGHNLLEPLTTVVGPTVTTVWTPWYLLYASLASAGGLLIGLIVFRRLQYLFAEFI